MSLFIAGKLSTVGFCFFFLNVASPSVSRILLTQLFDGHGVTKSQTRVSNFHFLSLPDLLSQALLGWGRHSVP